MLSTTKNNEKFYLTIGERRFYTESTPENRSAKIGLKKQTAKKACECIRECENSFSGKGGKIGGSLFGEFYGKLCVFGAFGLLSEISKTAENKRKGDD